MSSTMVPEDGSTVSRLDRAVFLIERIFALIAGLTILGIVLVSVANIVGRKFKDWALEAELGGLAAWLGPVPGFVDWMEQAVPVIAFFGIAYCQRLGGHIRMDLVVGSLKGRVLYLAEFVGVLFLLILVLVLIWGSWLHFERSFDWNAPLWSRDSTIDLSLPVWPVKLVVPVLLALLAIRLALQLWAYGRALRTNPDVAVGVPRIENAAEQAEREAESVSSMDTDDGPARPEERTR